MRSSTPTSVGRVLVDALGLGGALALADALIAAPFPDLLAAPPATARALLVAGLGYGVLLLAASAVLRSRVRVAALGGGVLVLGHVSLHVYAQLSADAAQGGFAWLVSGVVGVALAAAVAGAAGWLTGREGVRRGLRFGGVGFLCLLGSMLLLPEEDVASPPVWPELDRAVPAGDLPSLLVVTMDTVRPDHLEPYGSSSIKTPNLQRLAEEGTLFERAVAQAPRTPPSHASLLTGLYPNRHGVRGFHSTLLPGPDVPALAELLRARGYVTGAVVAAAPLDPSYGLWRGFDIYHYAEPAVDYVFLPMRKALLPIALETAGILRNRNDYRPAREIAADALRFLRAYRERPFMLWVHFYDPHLPYAPESEHRASEFHPGKGVTERLSGIHGYDSEIVGVDAYIGQLLDDLQSSGRLDDTIVVVTSDHGEGFGQHGYQGHTHRIWEEQLRIPLILRFPPAVPAGLRVATQIRSIDVMPTVLELVGMRVPDGLDGESLVPTIVGDDRRDRLSFAELQFRNRLEASLYSASDGRFKLIRSQAGERQLFDLEEDPGELRNVVDSQPEVLARLDEALDHYLDTSPRSTGDSGEMDPELRERLEALGYLK